MIRCTSCYGNGFIEDNDPDYPDAINGYDECTKCGGKGEYEQEPGLWCKRCELPDHSCDCAELENMDQREQERITTASMRAASLESARRLAEKAKGTSYETAAKEVLEDIERKYNQDPQQD